MKNIGFLTELTVYTIGFIDIVLIQSSSWKYAERKSLKVEHMKTASFSRWPLNQFLENYALCVSVVFLSIVIWKKGENENRFPPTFFCSQWNVLCVLTIYNSLFPVKSIKKFGPLLISIHTIWLTQYKIDFSFPCLLTSDLNYVKHNQIALCEIKKILPAVWFFL